MTLSEVGTSFADILTALPVIGGLGLVLSGNPEHRSRYAIAGLLLGAAVGLKLTIMVFFIAAGRRPSYPPPPSQAPLSLSICHAPRRFPPSLARGLSVLWSSRDAYASL